MLHLWVNDTGFKNFQPGLDHMYAQIAKANKHLKSYHRKLNPKIIDVCIPELYKTGHNLLITNSWIVPGQLDPARYQQFPDSWCGIYAGQVRYEPMTPLKKFNCFINRMDPIRQSWFYQLIRRDILERGLISFNMDISNHILQNQCAPNDTSQQVFENQFQHYLQIFQPEHEVAKTMVPYRNFDCDLNTAVMQTEFSVVLETYFESGPAITFSEKIFRCLKLPRPWLLFAMSGAVNHLRNLGFDVLDDLVDHSYDLIEHDIWRQVALLDEIQARCAQTLSGAEIARCEQAAQHNQQRLDEMLASFHKDVNTSCLLAIDKCMAL